MLPAGRAPVVDKGPRFLEVGGGSLRYIWASGKIVIHRNFSGDAYISCNLSKSETADSKAVRSALLAII